ncbi:hypothetical protein ABE65_020520 [Fictibacillus phosphorivorans]|uniref:DUF4367 domain-containing protein n=1 Tax=Fictibacillus phosphorivorans TaxID=1221500 RepID=A0A160IRW8_9BACL|nr:hypothetical protein [Fictibacillus phosphorivorans]ANC79057.1 hypothetical protein ABE65_020520 [Fictibacillus phosphorivorans]
MKKWGWFVVVILAVLLAGCSSEEKRTLNDKGLTLQEHPKGAYPRYYDQVSKKKAQKAVPFSLELPNQLPFKVALSTYQISDWGEKRNILVDSVFYPEQQGQNVYLAYRVSNFLPKTEKLETNEEVELSDGTDAYFSGSADLPILAWKKDGLFYKMEYLMKEGTDRKAEKKKLIEAASSVFE